MQNNEAPPNRLLNLEGTELPRGNYYLEKLVSVSNMSVIYKAVDRSSQRHVAVKILLNERYYHRFKNEVDITWGQKNNIASAIRSDVEGERLPDGTRARYLVMKWLSGPSLSDRIRAFRMESRSTPELLDFTVRVLAKLAAALDDMHRIGIVHLDIKPSNILFNTDDFEMDEPYIIDFGIAHWIRETGEDQTVIEPEEMDAAEDKEAAAVDAEHPGTANYMPPEQWAGVVNSGATDQYALAITVYEILSGRVSPYQALLDVLATTTTGSSQRTGRREVWRKGHEIEEPTPVHTYRPDVPRAVWPVLLRALDKDPRRRYATVGEFYRAFQSAAQQPLETLPLPYGAGAQAQLEKSRPSLSARLIPFLTGAIGLLLVAGLMVLIVANQPPGGVTPTPMALAAVTETVEPTAPASVVTDEPGQPPTASLLVETDAATEEIGLPVTEEPTDTSEPATQLPPETPTPTRTASARTSTLTATDTPSVSRTPTNTSTRTPSRTPTSTPAPTLVPVDALALLTQISDASRSANNFNCVAFNEAYEAFESAVDRLDESEQEIITPLFGRTSPLRVLNAFCANPQNRDDESVQLPSNLASDEFRDLRTLVRAAMRDVEALREE